MARCARWLIVVGMLIGLAMPQRAYACTPSPPHWKVTIAELEYPYDPNLLPDGLTLKISGNAINIENRTDQRATLGGIVGFNGNIIKAGSTFWITEPELYRDLFPSNYSDHSAYYSAYMDEAEPPPLTGEVKLTLRHDGELYTIPITAYYDIDYVTSDGGAGCAFTYLFNFLCWPPVMAGILLLVGVIGAIIWQRRGSKPTQP